jgi:hypothetical protein
MQALKLLWIYLHVFYVVALVTSGDLQKQQIWTSYKMLLLHDGYGARFER